MLAVIEVASSGLGSDSFPIAVAWRILGTAPETHLLIQPAPGWHGWQREAEKMHGIARDRLQREGWPAEAVTARLTRDLARATVFSDSVSLDQSWIDRLYAAVPGSRPLSLRRYSELFPGTTAVKIDQAIRDAEVPATPWKTLDDLRRRVLVAERFLAGMSQAMRPPAGR